MSTRRGHHEGTITQRKDGRWEVRVRLPNGMRKSFYAATKPAARAKLKAALEEIAHGVDVSKKPMTVAQLLDQWLTDVVQPKRAPKTYQSYEQIIRVHIIPPLGHIRVDKLTAADIEHALANVRPHQRGCPPQSAPGIQPQTACDQQQGRPDPAPKNRGNTRTSPGAAAPTLAPRTIQYVRAILRTALNRAVKQRVIPYNPVDATDPIVVRRAERRPLTPDQARILLDHAQGDRHEALYRVALSLGLRLGEALGLAWSDVDFAAGNLTVRSTLQRVNGTLSRKEPKTDKSRRMLYLPPTLVTSLRAHRTRQLEERLAAGSRWTGWDVDLVFTNSVGGPMEPSNVLKCLKKVLRDAGLPQQRFHDLRHCAASLLIAQGLPIKVVADVLGHSQLSTTADIYGHLFDDAKRDAADAMERVLAHLA